MGTIAGQTLTVGRPAAAVDVSGNFSDPDNDTLTYTAESDDTGVATVEVSGSSVAVTPVAAGSSDITVPATDPSNATATQIFTVMPEAQDYCEGVPARTVTLSAGAGAHQWDDFWPCNQTLALELPTGNWKVDLEAAEEGVAWEITGGTLSSGCINLTGATTVALGGPTEPDGYRLRVASFYDGATRSTADALGTWSVTLPHVEE